MSTHWIRVQVVWLHEGWGCEQMFYQRQKGKNSAWSEEEKEIVRACYPTAPKWDVMRLLPDRGWCGITQRAKLLGIEGRKRGSIALAEREKAKGCLMPLPGDKVSSYSDLVFLAEFAIDP